MTVGVTQGLVQFLGYEARSPVHFSSAWTTVLGQDAAPKINFTQEYVALLGTQPLPERRISNINVQVLGIRAPNMDWNPMIFADVFPNDISYNSVGTIRFSTDVIVVDSGDDQRVRRWSQPLMEYDVAYGVRTMEQLQELIAFFRAMNGRLYAFNYRDWMDYTSSMAVAYEAREAPPISGQDQFQFVGDGSTYIFQLVKNYVAQTSGQTQTRPITRPEPGTVKVWLSGAGNGDWGDNVSVDEGTGIVTLTSPLQVTGAITNEGSGYFSCPDPIFLPLRPFVGRRLVMSGFANASNNGGLTDLTITLVAVGTGGHNVTIGYSAGGAVLETANATVAIHPAPPSGVSVYAGFQFYVPVRFDTDQLPLTLEDYGVGGAQSIKLIEVRPTAF